MNRLSYAALALACAGSPALAAETGSPVLWSDVFAALGYGAFVLIVFGILFLMLSIMGSGWNR